MANPSTAWLPVLPTPDNGQYMLPYQADNLRTLPCQRQVDGHQTVLSCDAGALPVEQVYHKSTFSARGSHTSRRKVPIWNPSLRRAFVSSPAAEAAEFPPKGHFDDRPRRSGCAWRNAA